MHDDIGLIRRMVEFYSPATEEAELSAFLVDQMRKRGFKTHQDEVGNAVGEVGCGDRHIALIGHIDTAPGIVPVREEGGVLYGRGSVDAKGSFATFVCAASRLKEVTGTRITVIGAVEEECPTSKGAWHLVDRMHPDCVVIGEPSGWDNITIGYKGIVGFRYRKVQPNAHFAGDNVRAGEHAIGLYNALAGYTAERSGKGEFDSPRLELRRFLADDDGLMDTAETYLAVRIPPAFDIDGLISFVTGTAGDADVVCDQRLEGVVTSKNTPLIRAFLKSIRAAGGRPSFTKKTGTSDMCVVGPAWGCPIVAYGPGDSRLDHRPDEHLPLVEYTRAIDVLTSALKEIVK
ncbi:MAG: [LysW]-lysine hydrolase [Gemmatimonadota bacterium]|nr:[LysW]-lysine hydrolase [Gemmatimonadota bacterium]